MSKPLISIIIRTKNEERWIKFCLEAIFKQDTIFTDESYGTFDFEVIVVDNMSTDRTVEIVSLFNVKIVKISKFRPGYALNQGIRVSRGEILVFLSGHCIPKNSHWLKSLITPFFNKNNVQRGLVAGVYGKQEPLSYSSPQDKRDLLTVFGNEKIVQRANPLFHNANSAIRRNVWELHNFDEDATNVEDRIWAKEIFSLNKGYEIHYEPSSVVWHWHGINHKGDPQRAQSVVQVLESRYIYNLKDSNAYEFDNSLSLALIPFRYGDMENEIELKLIRLLTIIKQLLFNLDFEKIYIVANFNVLRNPIFKSLLRSLLTDNEIEVLNRKVHISLRIEELDGDFQNVFQILENALSRENESFMGKRFLFMNLNYPLRDWNQIKEVIEKAKIDSSLFLPVFPIAHSTIHYSGSETQFINSIDGKFLNLEERMPKALESAYKHIVHYGYGSILSTNFLVNRGFESLSLYLYELSVETTIDVSFQTLQSCLQILDHKNLDILG